MTDWDAVERGTRRAIASLQIYLARRDGLDFRPDPADLAIPNTSEPVADESKPLSESATAVS